MNANRAENILPHDGLDLLKLADREPVEQLSGVEFEEIARKIDWNKFFKSFSELH
jgi:hypothetical protein